MQAAELQYVPTEGYVPGEKYTFPAPVKATCIAVGASRPSMDKLFLDGRCLNYSMECRAFIFRGTPIGEEGVYYFLV